MRNNRILFQFLNQILIWRSLIISIKSLFYMTFFKQTFLIVNSLFFEWFCICFQSIIILHKASFLMSILILSLISWCIRLYQSRHHHWNRKLKFYKNVSNFFICNFNEFISLFLCQIFVISKCSHFLSEDFRITDKSKNFELNHNIFRTVFRMSWLERMNDV